MGFSLDIQQKMIKLSPDKISSAKRLLGCTDFYFFKFNQLPAAKKD
jgi:hypothetical protein